MLLLINLKILEKEWYRTMTKLSYAWVRNTPLFKSVSTGLTFKEKHKLAVDLMVAYLSENDNIDFEESSLYMGIIILSRTPQGFDYWYDKHKEVVNRC